MAVNMKNKRQIRIMREVLRHTVLGVPYTIEGTSRRQNLNRRALKRLIERGLVISWPVRTTVHNGQYGGVVVSTIFQLTEMGANALEALDGAVNQKRPNKTPRPDPA